MSPPRISRRLPLDFPDDPSMRACPSTIYRWIYERPDLIPFLSRGHEKRRKGK